MPEYVFALYRQVADSMLPTQREAYMASLLSSVPALDGTPPGDPQVNFQEYGCCFTLFYLEDIIACGCDEPECKDGVYQLISCAASPSRGPLRCAWFDTQSRYASVAMTPTEAIRARTQYDMHEGSRCSTSVCARSATAATAVKMEEGFVTPITSPSAVLSPPLRIYSDSSAEIATEMLHWLNDPSLTSSSPVRPRSPPAQSVYDDAESPLHLTYVVGDCVMLRHSTQELGARPDIPLDDGPYIVAEVLGSATYRVVREHDSLTRVVHATGILHRLLRDASEIEDSAPAHDTSCAGSLTNKDDAACRTSDSAVASWLNDAASHFPQPGATLTQLLETPTPAPAEKSVVNARRKRALNATSSGDDKPALEPSKRRKQSVLCALCERD